LTITLDFPAGGYIGAPSHTSTICLTQFLSQFYKCIIWIR